MLINRTPLQLECPQKPVRGSGTGRCLRSPTLVPPNPQQLSPISILNLGLKTETLAILKSTYVLPKARTSSIQKSVHIFFGTKLDSKPSRLGVRERWSLLGPACHKQLFLILVLNSVYLLTLQFGPLVLSALTIACHSSSHLL